jgi:hypothetical protein
LADGIQIAGQESGTRILNNEISGKQQADGSACAPYGGGCPHTDGIQWVSDSSDMVVSGNYMHGNTDDLQQDDGTNTNITVTNNVFAVADTSVRSVQVSGWHGGRFSHNTMNSLATWDSNHDGEPTSNVTLTDNVFVGGFGYGSTTADTGQFSNESYNLTTDCPNSCGPHDIKGRPTFAGGAKPSSYTGWELASGSLGVGNASDGQNRGADDFSISAGP